MSMPIPFLPEPQFNAALMLVPTPIIKSNTTSPVFGNVSLEMTSSTSFVFRQLRRSVFSLCNEIRFCNKDIVMSFGRLYCSKNLLKVSRHIITGVINHYLNICKLIIYIQTSNFIIGNYCNVDIAAPSYAFRMNLIVLWS
jgi:hypothetical protein